MIQQFLVFAAVGAIGTACHYAVLIVSVARLHIDAIVGSIAGFVAGALVNYCLNYYLTFGSDKQHREAITKFFAVAVVGLILNTLIMTFATRLLEFHYFVAQIIATVIVLFSNYFANRAWTFNDTRKSQP